jgi:hypothetical protein
MEDVKIEDVSAELLKISHKLRLLADLVPQVVDCPPARTALFELSEDVREAGILFLELV